MIIMNKQEVHTMNNEKQIMFREFESKFRDKICRQNDEDYLFSDLTGLYMDIIHVISSTDRAKAVIIYDYAKLLEEELQHYSGIEACLEGYNAKDKAFDEILKSYMIKIIKSIHAKHLFKRTQACHDEIAELLGDKRGLLSEFTETYRDVHGIIASNIHEFTQYGYIRSVK